MTRHHPTDFYIVHIFCAGFSNPWGSLTDGPADLTEAKEAICDRFRDGAPTVDDIRVLHITADAPARYVTEDVIRDMAAYWPESQGEAA